MALKIMISLNVKYGVYAGYVCPFLAELEFKSNIH